MASFPVLKQETLFRNGTWSYRIPALLYLPRFSIILAFAEEREDVVDEHAKLIAMRRGMYDPTTHHVQVPEWGGNRETAQPYCYPVPNELNGSAFSAVAKPLLLLPAVGNKPTFQ